MKRTSCVTNLSVGLLVALAACGGDDGVTTPTPTGPFQLIFQGDAVFGGPHEPLTSCRPIAISRSDSWMLLSWRWRSVWA